VAFIGVLAAVAIPSYRSYLQRSRTTEAFTFLAEFRQRQEAYRAEFGQYCSVSAAPGSSIDSGAWEPASLPTNGDKIGWTGGGGWSQLGANPDGPVRFQYRTTAGPPGTTPGIPGFTGSDFWYAAQAQADLDGDGRRIVIEVQSLNNQLFIGDQGYTPLYDGWE
ncbi:MAG: type IV pilin protein, partial [Sandaracinaceae bacterium]